MLDSIEVAADKSRSARKQRRTRQQWQSLVDQFDATDLSVRDFCQQQSLSYQSFTRWRSLLKQDVATENSDWVELPAMPSPPEHGVVSDRNWLIELQVGDAVLRIRAG